MRFTAMAMIDEVKQLEDSLLEYQKQLSDFIYRYNSSDEKSPLLAQQIRNCRENLNNLQRQLTEIEKSMGVPVSKAAPAAAPVRPAATAPAPAKTPAPAKAAAPARMFMKQKPEKDPADRKPKNIEATIGKSVMGILASVLIFISFALVVSAFYPLLTKEVKMGLMFGVSALFTIVGLIKLKNSENNPLWLSLTGCGIGGFYISLFLSDIYFNVINDIVLYVLLLIWCIAVCILSRKKSFIFQIIGLIGIIISVSSGYFVCKDNSDTAMMLCLTIYTIIACVIFQIANRDREEYYRNWPSAIASVICLVPLSNWEVLGARAAGVVLIAYIVVQLGCLLVVERPGKYSGVLAGMIIANALMLNMNFDNMISNIGGDDLKWLSVICAFALYTLLLIVVEAGKKWKETDIAYYFLHIFILLGFAFAFYTAIEDCGWPAPMVILPIVYFVWGRVSEKNLFKALGVAASVIALLGTEIGVIPYLVTGLILIAVFYVTEFVNVSKYKSVYTLIMYFVSLLYIGIGIDGVINEYLSNSSTSELVVVAVIGLINLAVMHTRMLSDPITGESDRALHISTIVINAILMLLTLDSVAHSSESALYILLAAAFFSATTVKLLENEKFIASLYVGIKYTVLILAITSRYDVSEVWVSLVMLVVAIACIVGGFVIKRKGIRMYGLVLSLISVIKLVILDIDYDNSFSRAVSFFICGILCFLISFIYNQVDKKMKSEETE